MDEFLSLKWKNHSSTFLQVLGIIRKDQTYSDVTLTCSGKFYSAHKFVLTACSDYFHEIFEHTDCKKPVIIINGITYKDLEVLLDYMYLGEVNVKQSDITSLIKAAEYLQIKGLAVADEEPVTARKSSARRPPSPPRDKRKRKSNEAHCSSPKHFKPDPKLLATENVNSIVNKIEESDEGNHIFIKEEFSAESEEQYEFPKHDSLLPDDSSISNVFITKSPVSDNQENYLKEMQPSVFQGDCSEWIGPEIDNNSMQSETNSLSQPHKGMRKFYCKECPRWFWCNSALEIHIRTHTGEKPYNCPHCIYQARTNSNLTSHLRRKHKDLLLCGMRPTNS